MLTNEGREYGRLLLKMETPQEKGLMSTGARTFVVMVHIILSYVVFSFVMKHSFETLYDPADDNNTMFYALFVVMLCIVVFSILVVINTLRIANKVKLLLYENKLIGVATQKQSELVAHFEEFCLSYDEIYNVGVSGRYVVLHTKWCTYYVLAFKRQNEIVNIINEQRELWMDE